MSDSEQKIVEELRETLDQSVERLPAEVRSRLTRARHQALAAAQRPRSVRLDPWLYPAGGFAAVLLTLLLWQGTTATRPPELTTGFGVEMVLTAEELDVVEELDFLLWLEQQTDAG